MVTKMKTKLMLVRSLAPSVGKNTPNNKQNFKKYQTFILNQTFIQLLRYHESGQNNL